MNITVMFLVRKSDALRIHSGRMIFMQRAANSSTMPITLPGMKCPVRDEIISPASRKNRIIVKPMMPMLTFFAGAKIRKMIELFNRMRRISQK